MMQNDGFTGNFIFMNFETFRLNLVVAVIYLYWIKVIIIKYMFNWALLDFLKCSAFPLTLKSFK